LANHLKLIRQQNGWTQSELASRVGIKQATISNFENSPDKTTLSTLFKLLQSLEMNMVILRKNDTVATATEDNPQDDLDW
jgi:HTH-type transcriptional regulator/antitoxin HipB